jgi:uncharacterized Zn-binding protein involved in type VI secretion
MTQPAARIGDSTVHGGVIVAGAPTVLIGGKPASRIGDMHTCPLSSGVPHVGGPILLGSFTVLVSGFPQARISDIALCVGPPDSVAVGEPTVLVGSAVSSGFAGATGAVLGGLLAGAKNLLSSGPKAFMRPDGTVYTQYNKAIAIDGTAEYQATVIADLNELARPLEYVDPATGKKVAVPSTGGKLLEAVTKSGRKVAIAPIAGPTQGNAFASPDTPADSVPKASGKPGKGSDSSVSYNPSLTMGYTAIDGSAQSMPPHQILGHELTHALHNAKGENLRDQPDPMMPGDNQEEARTIGVHGFESEPISERRLSDEAGRSPRPDHDSVREMTYRAADGNWYSEAPDATGAWTLTGIPAPAAPMGDRPNR